MIHFLQPLWLWLLLLLPIVMLWHGQRGPVAAVEYSNVNLARRVANETRSRSGRWLWLLPLLAAALMIVGLARPQYAHGQAATKASGIDMVLAIDVSGSMQALDFKVDGVRKNRIDIVKSVVSKFIDDRPDDRIGIIAFAGAPYLVSPPTLDHDWLQQNLERVKIGGVEDGTAIGSAIASGVNRLRGSTAKSKVMVLLTDGQNNLGKISPLAAAEAAKVMGIKVYTIGAGVRGNAPVPVTDEHGNPVLDESGDPKTVDMMVDVDEDMLQKIATETGGKFYRATDTESLRNIYSEINQLEKTTFSIKKYEHFQELFAWAVLPALAVLGLWVALGQTRYRRLP